MIKISVTFFYKKCIILVVSFVSSQSHNQFELKNAELSFPPNPTATLKIEYIIT